MIAFFIMTAVSYLFIEHAVSPVIIGGALAVAVLSFIDDCHPLSATLRLLVHMVVTLLVVSNGFQIAALQLPGWAWQWPEFVAAVFSLFYVVWLINLYNFMDGMDGFAAGMAIIGFGCFALLGWQQAHQAFTVANLIVVGAVAGFLVFNFPPARIFMGDTGASTLGFLVALFSIWAEVDGIFPLWLAVLIFSPFIVDASVTLGRRLLAGERVWEAHRSHYYQRLVQLGWGHRQTVLYSYLLMLLCALSAWLAVWLDTVFQWLIVIAWICLYVCIIVRIGRLARSRDQISNGVGRGEK